jgi:hypothetical protein
MSGAERAAARLAGGHTVSTQSFRTTLILADTGELADVSTAE